MKNFIQSGKNMTVPAAAVTKSGDLVVAGLLFGVSTNDAKIGDELELDCSGGVYDLPKVPAQAWTVGQAIHWDADAKLATNVPGDDIKIGVAALPAANPSAGGRVRLNANF